MATRTQWNAARFWALAGGTCVVLLFSGSHARTRGAQKIEDQRPRLTRSHPSVLAGRLERSSAPGRYIDVHAPLTAAEAPALAHYRPAPGPARSDTGPRRAGYIDLGGPRRFFGPRTQMR